jgi:hypothetical protein
VRGRPPGGPRMITALFAVLAAAGLGGLTLMARREHRAALDARARLLDPVAGLFAASRIEMAADGFPMLTGRLPDRRQVTVELVPDTLVMRRLPQLWLVVTLRESVERRRPSIGALARPTGAEFYSLVHGMPERIETPAGLDPAILMRGERFGAAEAQRVAPVLAELFADLRVKEIAATPRGLRIVRQASEGERGAHLLLRQSRFPLAAVSPDLVARAVAEADRLREALDGEGRARLSA